MDQEWYQKFVSEENVDRDLLFELLTAANFMGIKPLLNLTCLKVTFLLADKSAEEVSSITFRSKVWRDCFIVILNYPFVPTLRSVRFSNSLS